MKNKYIKILDAELEITLSLLRLGNARSGTMVPTGILNFFSIDFCNKKSQQFHNESMEGEGGKQRAGCSWDSSRKHISDKTGMHSIDMPTSLSCKSH